MAFRFDSLVVFEAFEDEPNQMRNENAFHRRQSEIRFSFFR